MLSTNSLSKVFLYNEITQYNARLLLCFSKNIRGNSAPLCPAYYFCLDESIKSVSTYTWTDGRWCWWELGCRWRCPFQSPAHPQWAASAVRPQTTCSIEHQLRIPPSSSQERSSLCLATAWHCIWSWMKPGGSLWLITVYSNKSS